MARCYPKEHDILKLSATFKGRKIHYCPHAIADADPGLFAMLKDRECYRSLRHHCIFGSYSSKHFCDPDEFFPLSREEFFLALADVKASVISRKLNVGYRKGPRQFGQSTWDVYHVWKSKGISECSGTEPTDERLVPELATTGDLPAAFKHRAERIERRSEDAWKCPFASLMTHSELTERWFHFFTKNYAYFGVLDTIENTRKATALKNQIQGSRDKRHTEAGLPIVFVRLKLFANQSLSRMADTEIIRTIDTLVKRVPACFEGAQELYRLYDEIILVIPFPGTFDLKGYIDKALKCVEGFTTNYYFEGTHATTRLVSKDLLKGYNELFQGFRHTYYPTLPVSINPDYAAVTEGNEEAYHAKLCELCNMAEAVVTFRKFNADEERIYECLCVNCHAIRVRQQEANADAETGTKTTHGIGYKIARWEKVFPHAKLCFIKTDIDLSVLSTTLRRILLEEFPLPRPTDHYKDENVGFSIMYEFLREYETFLRALRAGIYRIPKFAPNLIDKDTGVSNEFQVLENFLCLRLDDLEEMKEILAILSRAYERAFPQFWPSNGRKNKDGHPITFSVTVSSIKFPFFEGWRYLNSPKATWMNVLATRAFELAVNPAEYLELNKIDYRQLRISRFLHKLSEIDRRTRSDLLLNTEIFNNRYDQNEIFQGVMRRAYGIHNLLSFYKLARASK
jgi:hypothetical protein